MKRIVSLGEFAQLDLRVGRVLDVEDVKQSTKLYKMTVDLGSDYGRRIVFVGVKAWYKPDQLKGKNFIFVANLAPRRMMGGESQGMMLAADSADKPTLILVASTVPPGTSLR